MRRNICHPAFIPLSLRACLAAGALFAAALPAYNDCAGDLSHAPLDLDLSSTHRCLTAALAGLTNDVAISAAAATLNIAPDNWVTPAELIAALQVASGQRQNLRVGPLGNATEGQFALGGSLAHQIGNLVIPENVTLLMNSSRLTLNGALTNFGAIEVASAGLAPTSATIAAREILNGTTGWITNAPLAPRADADTGLVLNASERIENHGAILSAGRLTLRADMQIVNAEDPKFAPGSKERPPLLRAVHEVNLWSSQIVNSGLIACAGGDLNIGRQKLRQI